MKKYHVYLERYLRYMKIFSRRTINVILWKIQTVMTFCKVKKIVQRYLYGKLA